jgi:hypothetical protein
MPAPPSCTAELLRHLESGARVKYLHFWGDHPRPHDTLGLATFGLR